MAKAEIDYGHGRATLWGSFDRNVVESEFYRKAGECFGIRKSISGCTILNFDEASELPDPWRNFAGAATVLKHSGGDTIVWDAEGEKIKSEWD